MRSVRRTVSGRKRSRSLSGTSSVALPTAPASSMEISGRSARIPTLVVERDCSPLPDAVATNRTSPSASPVRTVK